MKINQTITLSKQELADHVASNMVSFGFYELAPELTLLVCSTKLGIINALFCDPTDTKSINTILSIYPLQTEITSTEITTLLQQQPLVLAGTRGCQDFCVNSFHC